jgi:hypothetical protein
MDRTQQIRAGIPLLLVLLFLCAASAAHAFCGFYVARGDARIFNRASKVVVARDGDRTVVTMASDFQGDPKEFAVVVPVPTVLQRGQVHVGDSSAVDHLDAYSAPRLVEYTDPNPCPAFAIRKKDSSTRQVVTSENLIAQAAISRGGEVHIRAQYKVDEYDILILSATEGQALDRWLTQRGYTLPPGAAPVLHSYIRQGMFFFVAKVDLAAQRRLGYSYLRPIQVAFESPKFMLPIRLGMANASGPQEMFVFFLTRWGRVETTNYRTVRLPTNQDVPEFVKADFAEFCRRLFDVQYERNGRDAVFLEYVWNVVPNTAACDPCSAPVLRPHELRGLGAFWISLRGGHPGEVVLTRLHLRYDARHFPEDLIFQETRDRTNWQARYVVHHPYRGPDECPELKEYWPKVWERRRKEAGVYAELTGLPLEAVQRRMGVREDWSEPEESLVWWERIWAR